MIVTPYKRPPTAPTMAVLLETGTHALDEHGERHRLARVPRGTHVYASHELAEDMLMDGRGELLTWNGKGTRWRAVNGGDAPGEWKPRPSDVRLLYQEFPPRPGEQLRGLTGWRDWLARYEAAPSSMGGAALSLLRASLEQPLWTNSGERPPLQWTLGGRIQRAVDPGHYTGPIVHYDLPAAYGRTIGELRYGGRWVHFPQEKLERFELWRRGEPHLPAFVRARVRIPSRLDFGPLPRRPRRLPRSFKARGVNSMLIADWSYPVGRRLSSLWTVQELARAAADGCTVEALEAWMHFPPRDRQSGEPWQPFLPWWRRVEQQRNVTAGFEQQLVKGTGNSLWGMFAMNERRRTILSGKPKQRRKTDSPLPGGRPPAHDLAETVCGRVRAELYGLMRQAGREHTLAVHTDGGWFLDGEWTPPEGWLVKDTAAELRLLMPSIHAFRRPRRRRWEYRFASVRRSDQERQFEAWWAWSFA